MGGTAIEVEALVVETVVVVEDVVVGDGVIGPLTEVLLSDKTVVLTDTLEDDVLEGETFRSAPPGARYQFDSGSPKHSPAVTPERISLEVLIFIIWVAETHLSNLCP